MYLINIMSKQQIRSNRNSVNYQALTTFNIITLVIIIYEHIQRR